MAGFDRVKEARPPPLRRRDHEGPGDPIGPWRAKQGFQVTRARRKKKGGHVSIRTGSPCAALADPRDVRSRRAYG